ncbi:Hypothetical_protein [Hexamita inflata]|uniref:Hypothetical_protein n=1 Tax=Hexamita inflata TaxID=28002 RepID=A0AA86RKR8_9EUKA|nr:Hypothetical protein HINF_LOCUS61327 [Hexamita inflata]
MEIKLNETFNTLVISFKPEQKDANPYKQYFGLQYDCVKVRGNKKLFSLNYIDKYIIKADSVSLNDCLINLDQLYGKFKKITFKDCTLIGQTTNNFRTDQLILESKFELQQFTNSCFDILDIVILDKKQMIDFQGFDKVNKLNSLFICNLDFNPKIIQGFWNTVQLKNCKFSGTFNPNFSCNELIYHGIDGQNPFSDSVETKINKIQVHLLRVSDFKPNQFKAKQVNIKFQNCGVSLKKLQGSYNRLEFKACWFQNPCPLLIFCLELVFESCYMQQYKMQSFKAHQCIIKNLYSYDHHIIAFPFVNEVEVDNAYLSLTNPSTIKKLTLKNSQIQNLSFLMLNDLKSLQITNTKKNQQTSNLERIIIKRKKFELKQNENEKQIVRIDKDSGIKFKNIVQMEEDVEYLKYLLESVQIGVE